MYHSISDDPEPGVHPYYRVCTNPKRFAEQMQWLEQAGYRGVTLREGLAWLNASPESRKRKAVSRKSAAHSESQLSVFEISALERPLLSPISHLPSSKSERLVALSFDDGFQDFYTAAWPVLQQHGFTATVYLPTAFIGDQRRVFAPRPSDGRGIKGEGKFSPFASHLSLRRECLTWPEVGELHAAGIEFGSHTMSHPVLYDLSWQDIELELRSSKLDLEQQLSAPICSFSHPFAFPQEDRDYVIRLKGLLQETGYSNAVTTRVGRTRKKDVLFILGRLPANSDDDEPLFLAKLAGHYDWLAYPQAAVRKIKRTPRLAGKQTEGPVQGRNPGSAPTAPGSYL